MENPSGSQGPVERPVRLDRLGLARALTRIERAESEDGEFAVAVDHSAHVVGITGPPGVGKSTLVAALTTHLREAGGVVAVLAVDPSSPVTGGALLGDRIRMSAQAADDGVFIRSLANRGQLGGLSAAVPAAIRAAISFGADTVLVETVGVGQSDVDIASQADTTIVVTSPAAGDSVQAGKAGLLEVADILVVNKSDLDGATQAVRDLREAQRPRSQGESLWRVPVVPTRADAGEGVAELVARLREHVDQQRASGALQVARADRARDELLTIAMNRLSATLREWLTADVEGLVADVRAGRRSPAAAADAVVTDMLRTTT